MRILDKITQNTSKDEQDLKTINYVDLECLKAIVLAIYRKNITGFIAKKRAKCAISIKHAFIKSPASLKGHFS